MLRTIEKYWGAISSIAFSAMLVLLLYVDPKLFNDCIRELQRTPQMFQNGILVLAIVTLWAGIKEFTG